MMARRGQASLLARFATPEAMLAALDSLRAEGHEQLEAFSPYPIEGATESLAFRPRWLPVISLALTVVVVVSGYFMEWYSAVVDYPYVVGGKPLHSWPAFIPVVVALGLLASVIGAVVAMVAGNRLPQPYHPAFEAESFLRASDDAFFVRLVPGDCSDETWQHLSARLDELGAREILEVPQ